MNQSTHTCPLCQKTGARDFAQDNDRTYSRCENCLLIFVHPRFRLDSLTEKRRYDLHENFPDDPRYRKFLFPLFDEVSKRISPKSRGLDFGCGPGSALRGMFEEFGHSVELYDPFFAPCESALEREYDFIVASEVAEHLFSPKDEFKRIWDCLKPGGVLGVMTAFVPEDTEFSKWYYIRDDTHVCFYSRKTLGFMAKKWGCKVEFFFNRIACFLKPVE